MLNTIYITIKESFIGDEKLSLEEKILVAIPVTIFACFYAYWESLTW